jgi:hypothetical protein
MPGYRERLRVPLSWWLAGLVVVGLLGTEVAAGFGWQVTVAAYGVLGGGYAAMLVSWGRATVEVTSQELRAGAARLPLAAVGEVTALDRAQASALRGPRANPGAFLLVRPYLPRAVYVEVTGGKPGAAPPGGEQEVALAGGEPGAALAGGGEAVAPYWLIGTRHPAQLAAAITSARVGMRRSPGEGEARSGHRDGAKRDEEEAAGASGARPGQPGRPGATEGNWHVRQAREREGARDHGRLRGRLRHPPADHARLEAGDRQRAAERPAGSAGGDR